MTAHTPRIRVAGIATLVGVALLFTLLAWSTGRRGEAVVMVPAVGAIAAGLFLGTRGEAGMSASRTGAAIVVVIGLAVYAFCAYLVLFVGAQPV